MSGSQQQSKSQQGESQQGESQQGESQQGESQQGESQQGESQQGESQQGESQQGESQQGESQQGESQQGESQQGESQQGESQQGESQQGESQQNSVSVVIPAYNGEKYLGQAIESVRAQTVVPLQIIVIDDGSTDDTARVAQSFAGVEYYIQENSGAAQARNNGAQRASGEYLAFLDADDLWTPNKLEVQLAAFTPESKPDMVFGHGEQFISPELTPEEQAKIHIPNERIPAIIPGAMLLRRAAFFQVGLLETSWQVGEFIDWYLKASDKGLQTHIVPETVLRRRIHTANMGVLKRDARSDYVRILKASLDRRRKQAAERQSTH